MRTADIGRVAGRARHSRGLEGAARTGFAVSGVLHLLIALLALRVAWGAGSRDADQSGALHTVASHPGGRIALWIAVIGFLGLALWQVTRVATTRSRDQRRQWLDRGKSAATAVVYLALALTSARFATGGSTSSRARTQDFTAAVMHHPGGRVLVGVIGVVVVAVGCYHGFKGVSRRFLDELTEDPGAAVTWAGIAGYTAKGVALALVGGLFVIAAVRHRAKDASGLDGALHTLRQQPFGSVLLTAVAVGLAAYGVYCFVRARSAKV